MGCFNDLLGFHDLFGLQTMMLEEGPQCSLGKPRARLGLGCFGKKLHRSFAKTRAREGQYLCFPSRIADDGNLFKGVAVAEEKVCIAPLLAAFPSRKVFQQDEKLDGSGSGDYFNELGLRGIEFGFFQFTTDAKDAKATIMLFEIGAHRCIWYLVLEFEEGTVFRPRA